MQIIPLNLDSVLLSLHNSKVAYLNNKSVHTLISRELSGFTCTRSLTMNSKFSIPHETAD